MSLKKGGGDWSKAGYLPACLCAYHCTAHTQPCVVNSAVVNSVSQLPLLAVRSTTTFIVQWCRLKSLEWLLCFIQQHASHTAMLFLNSTIVEIREKCFFNTYQNQDVSMSNLPFYVIKGKRLSFKLIFCCFPLWACVHSWKYKKGSSFKRNRKKLLYVNIYVY
jgi:hypothetical protein